MFEREAKQTGRQRLLLTMAAAGGSHFINVAYEPRKIIQYAHIHVRHSEFLPWDCMQCNARYSRGKTVCLSVCLAVSQTSGVWQKKRKFCPHSYNTWKIIHPSFLTSRMVGRKRPFLPIILGQTDLFGAKTPIFNRYLRPPQIWCSSIRPLTLRTSTDKIAPPKVAREMDWIFQPA